MSSEPVQFPIFSPVYESCLPQQRNDIPSPDRIIKNSGRLLCETQKIKQLQFSRTFLGGTVIPPAQAGGLLKDMPQLSLGFPGFIASICGDLPVFFVFLCQPLSVFIVFHCVNAGTFADVLINVKQKSYHVSLQRQVCYSCFQVLPLINHGCTQHAKHYIMTGAYWHCSPIILASLGLELIRIYQNIFQKHQRTNGLKYKPVVEGKKLPIFFCCCFSHL